MEANFAHAAASNDPLAPVPILGRGELSSCAPAWSYEEAFVRNRGLITSEEQERLRGSRVAIAGMGGVGGIHLITLARLGVGRFTIADPDVFEVANYNRQYGATDATVGHDKVHVMAAAAQSINREVEIKKFPVAISVENIDEFLDGANFVIDGIDFFEMPTRRLLFQKARERGLWALTAGPIGFGTCWLLFSPRGMTFDDYFDLHDGMDLLDQVIAFAVGVAPRAAHMRYLDLREVDVRAGTAPSSALAAHLASGVAACETLKVLLGRGPVRPAPCYFQFDAYRQVLRKGRLLFGNRHPWQRFKRWWLRRRLARQTDH